MFDYILKEGLIVDGTRNKSFRASLCIKDDKIADITDDLNVTGNEVIDCKGKIISPGFIDLHTHSDACPINNSKSESMLHQGVTLQIAGNCGISLFPSNIEKEKEIRAFFERTVEKPLEDRALLIRDMIDYLQAASKIEQSINLGLLVGHGTLRASVMGFEDRKPTVKELKKMKMLLDKELKNGAFGMSLGLIYPPSSYGAIDEFIELAKVIKENKGILTVHMRNEGEKIFESIDEMVEVAKISGVHLHISHLKLMGKAQWGKSQQLLDYIEVARQKGLTITCDQYPYEATATGLAALVPDWAHDGGNSKMLERLEKKEERLMADVDEMMDKRGGPERIVIASTNGHLPEYDGKSIEEISKISGLLPTEAVIEILLKCKGEVAAIYFSLHLDDVYEIMKSMDISVGSDGLDFGYDVEYNPHPRNFGTFPRFLQIVRERNLMTIEDAIYKITALPANIINLIDRGTLKVGNIADITVFDFNKVEDISTFKKSAVKPRGIDHVFVAGKPALLNGKQSQHREGQIILKSSTLTNKNYI